MARLRSPMELLPDQIPQTSEGGVTATLRTFRVSRPGGPGLLELTFEVSELTQDTVDGLRSLINARFEDAERPAQRERRLAKELKRVNEALRILEDTGDVGWALRVLREEG